ncbi:MULTISPECIES: hypothetical protein [unclassified Exiguobacterium]|uniref:hypothetical protein n=1 Tax=unclassified Exiguobacterium TaxID=2644629 RepID=UPI001BE72CA8|nr:MULTISPECIES: hypothetical protein [unclassified Exiguobacterium]
MKRIIMLSVTLFLVFTPLVTRAESVTYLDYFGTTSITSTFMIADKTDANAYWSTVTVSGSSGEIIWYNYETEIGRTPTPVVDGQAPSNAHGFKLSSSDGGEVYAVNGHNTSPVTPYVEWGQPSNPDNPTVPEGDDCTRLECNQDLLDAMAAINNSTNSNGKTLSDILSGVTSLQQIATDSNNLLGEILGEIQTSMNPTLPKMTPPPKLSDNKPPMPSNSFEDTTIYFSDKGDATSEPEPLPTAPEPENWKNEDGSIINPDDEMTRDSEQSKDPQMNRDTEQTKDPQMNRDNEMLADQELQKDVQMNRDSQMTQTDNYQQDSVFEIDPVQTRDSEMTRTDQYEVDSSYTQDSEMNQNHFYEQSPVDKTLPRWKSN